MDYLSRETKALFYANIFLKKKKIEMMGVLGFCEHNSTKAILRHFAAQMAPDSEGVAILLQEIWRNNTDQKD